MLNRLSPRNLVIVGMLLMSGVSTEEVSAQWYPEWYDSLFFMPVEVYYPGEGDTGTVRATLQWSAIDWPYPGRMYAVAFAVQVSWSGPVVCDSFVPSHLMDDTMWYQAVIHSDEEYVGLAVGVNSSYPPLGSGMNEMGSLYFSVYDTGLVVLDSLQPPIFWPVPAVLWFGTFVRLQQRISIPGDFNGDGVPGEVADAVWLIDYVFGGFPADEPAPCADANGDCIVNISDAVYLIWYIFAGGPEPGPGCQF